MFLFTEYLREKLMEENCQADLIISADEDIIEYTKRILSDENNYMFINKVMEIAYHWLDGVKCPFPTWKEDVHYYNHLEEAFDFHPQEGVDKHLQHKVVHHIQKNITHSINVNRTQKEVRTGWDDE